MKNDILNLLFFYFIDVIKIGLVFWGILEFPLKKTKKLYLITVISALILISIAGRYINTNRSLFEGLITIILLITICVIFQGNLIRKLFLSLLVYVCIIFIDVCIAGGISLLFGISFEDIISHYIMNFVANSFNIVILSIIIYIKKRRGRAFGKNRLTKKIYALLFTGAVIGVFFVGGLMLTNLQGSADRTRRIVLAVIIITSFAYFAACMMIIMISESRDRYKVLSRINQTVIESQQRYYMLANEKEQEIRSIRHEMKNHFACINGLYKNNKFLEMHKYIEQLIEQSESLEELFDTGNDIVNAILNDAESRYRKEGIGIILKGMFPKEIYISPMDLCVIFANAVTNAVEAIQNIERGADKTYDINVKIGSFKEDLFIDIWNPVSHKVEVFDGKLKTIKKEKSLHGFGTANMKQSVEKYHGSIEFKCQENIFYVHIHMKNK